MIFYGFYMDVFSINVEFIHNNFMNKFSSEFVFMKLEDLLYLLKKYFIIHNNMNKCYSRRFVN